MAAIRKACSLGRENSLNRLRFKLSGSKDIICTTCIAHLHSISQSKSGVSSSCLFKKKVPCLSLNVQHIHSSNRSDKQDYYKVLGVDKNADAKDIKKAYYQLAKKYHPDVSKNDPNAAKKFQEISEAYEVLSDDTKRSQYDTFGMSGANMGGGGPGGGYGGFQGFEGFRSQVDPEELFRNMFKDFGFSGFENQDFDSKWGTAPATEIQMTLNFQEACRGVNKEVEINVTETCWQCNGSKAAPGSKPQRCPQCHGTGMETVSTGPFMMRSTCRMCGGQKTIIKQKCNVCRGKGKTLERKKVVVPVPAGIEDGQTVRLNVGEQEIFVTFRVGRSRIFRREGADVHSDATITLSQAVLGGTIRVPGIYDDILLNIPAGTQSHDIMKLSGKGISRVNSYGYGDHYIHFKIKVPLHLTPEQKALLMTYAETERNVDGTINGVQDTKEGKRALEDKEGYIKQIREALQQLKETDTVKPNKSKKSKFKDTKDSKNSSQDKPEDSNDNAKI
ncbi:protein tumorous imaginal discs, mitochondrial-like [Mercenaria mercenaria]|uniref:protein tumorous imaginal discs, mitochondrial-like n=1 Tax=Mercenaria mercenaria TaxID=6596 RepID=UPI00234E9E4E|nr:protein tumorous imaginal discs, mitochondrial-like [Mercenaria mercenaria]